MEDPDNPLGMPYVSLSPSSQCPNCLAVVEWGEQEQAHWITEKIVDGVEHGDWSCEEAPEDERAAAGYLMRFRYIKANNPATLKEP